MKSMSPYAEVDSIAVYYFTLPSSQDWILFYNFAFHSIQICSYFG